MFIGLWLVWPVRDDWPGSGELGAILADSALGPAAPPERLVPAGGPIEPR
jgi:hypothetical protein